MAEQPPLQGYVDPGFPNPNGANDAPIIIYGYTPALAVGLLGVILFGISTIWHTYQLLYYRTWYFIPVVVGTVMEVVGYTFRILSTRDDPYSVLYFVIEFFMIGTATSSLVRVYKELMLSQASCRTCLLLCFNLYHPHLSYQSDRSEILTFEAMGDPSHLHYQ